MYARTKGLAGLPIPRPVAKRSARRSVAVMQVGGRPMAIRPAGTRLYVPGFLSDTDQLEVDRAQALGIAPVVAVAAVKALKGLTKKPADKVAAEKVGALSAAVKQGNAAALTELLRGAHVAATIKARAVYLKALESLASAGVLTPGPQWRGHDAEIWAGTIIQPGQFQFRSGAALPTATMPVPPGTPGVAVTPPPQAPVTVSTPTGPMATSDVLALAQSLQAQGQQLPSWLQTVVDTIQAVSPSEQPKGPPVTTVQRAGFSLGGNVKTLALVGLGALVLSKLVGGRR